MRSRTAVPFVVIAVAFGLAAGIARAQDDPHAACAAPPSYVPAELLDRPVPLRNGIGNSHEAVTTTSKEAQAFYDQGLNYLESYVWIEASRSFHQALRLDPKLAMAYLGLSYVYSGLENPDGAKQFLEKAKALAAGVSERERRRIDIREKTARGHRRHQGRGPVSRLQEVHRRRAGHEPRRPGVLAPARQRRGGQRLGPRPARRRVVGRVLRAGPGARSRPRHGPSLSRPFLRDHRAHRRGARSTAKEYARLAPAIPHAAHMWGHDLRRVGRVDDAIAQFKKADGLENAYYAAEKIDPALDWHHAHNLDLLASCYEHKGQMKLAEQTLARVRRAGGRERLSRLQHARAPELPDPPRPLRRRRSRPGAP